MHYDHFIIGHGLAGAVLAHTLLDRTRSVKVFDPDPRISSSKVAAGVYNPVVVKRAVKCWMADDIFPYAMKFYSSMEKKLGEQLIIDRPLVRIIHDEKEGEVWTDRAASGALEPYLGKGPIDEVVNGPFKADHGTAVVHQAGNLRLKQFLSSSKDHLTAEGVFEQIRIDHAHIAVNEGRIIMGDDTAESVIFCEGYAGHANPWFAHLPFSPTKGEVIVIKTDMVLDAIVNKRIFILPIGDGLFKVGSTFNWRTIDEETTPAGRAELEEQLQRIYTVDYEVVEHLAGVRPSVSDRRPLIGRHHEQNNVLIFNGMGTRGVSYAPYLAANLADHIEQGLPIEPEADIQRFNPDHA